MDITDAMVDDAKLAWNGPDYIGLTDDLRAALTAAIGAGGQAVALREKVEEIRTRVERTICQTFSSDAGDIGEQGRISREDFDILVLSALAQPHPADERVVEARVHVPEGQTPLDDKLGHRLLDVIREGEKARNSGTGSPYHGHSLEHCLHAVGWVQRDLRLALDAARSATEGRKND